MIDENDNDSSSDEKNSSSDKKEKKLAAKKNGDSNSDHLESKDGDPVDKEEGKERRQEARLKNDSMAMVLVSIAGAWPEQNAKMGAAI